MNIQKNETKTTNFIQIIFSYLKKTFNVFIVFNGDLIVLFIFTFFINKHNPIFHNNSNPFRLILSYITIGVLFLIIGSINSIYKESNYRITRKILPKIILTCTSLSIIITLIPFLTPRLTMAKSSIILLFLGCIASMTIWRLFCVSVIYNTILKRNILLIDTLSTSEDYVIKLLKRKNGYKGNVILRTLNHDTLNLTQSRFEKFAKNGVFQLVLVKNISKNRLSSELFKLIKISNKYNMKVISVGEFIEDSFERIALSSVTFRNLQHILQKKENRVFESLIIRVIDISIAIIGLLIFVLLIPFIILLNSFLNKGHLFFSQKRVGLEGDEFYVHKLRSMVTDAEKHGAQMAQKNDNRITPFGKVLRKLRIDELPQLFNVLKGEMSLIGPRPERKIFVDELNQMEPLYSLRHLEKPGISGWAQVNYKYGENLEDSLKKLEYDLYYVKNKSLLLYFRTAFKTMKTILMMKGM